MKPHWSSLIVDDLNQRDNEEHNFGNVFSRIHINSSPNQTNDSSMLLETKRSTTTTTTPFRMLYSGAVGRHE